MAKQIKRSAEEELWEVRRRAEERNAWLMAFITWSVSVVVFVVGLVFWHPEGGPEPWQEVIKEFRNMMVSSSATVVFFGALYTIITRTNFDRVVGASITLTLGGNAKLFRRLSPEVRKQFIAANLSASLGKNAGEAVFDNVVDPLMAQTTSYRENFIYEIEAFDNVPVFPQPASADMLALQAALNQSGRYCWIRQRVTYDLKKPHGMELKEYAGPFLACLTFDESGLEKLMRRNEVFFREVVKLTDADRDLLLGLSEAELKSFVRTTLKFIACARITKKPVDYTIQVKREGSNAILNIVVDELDDLRAQGGLEITFEMPQLMSVTRFVVALPQPTRSPRISFKRAPHMKCLETVRFLSRLKAGAVKDRVDGKLLDDNSPPPGDPTSYAIEIDGWTFPTSGVMFVWENR